MNAIRYMSGAPDDPWDGTAVVNRFEYGNGTVVFILDSKKIGQRINTNYSDQFINSEMYNKTWNWYK